MSSFSRAVGICFAFLFCLLPAFVRAQSGRQCTPSFSFHDGWLGADAAYSIPLPDGRSVWIFGDTLYGARRVVEDNQPRMVRNSIGISNCKYGKWQLQYVIRQGHGSQSQASQPQDFFKAQTKGTWYWALDGFVHGRDLWVSLLCVRNASKRRPDGFDFETCGTDLAKVSDPGPDPQQWQISYFHLVPDGANAYPSATTVVDGNYVYLFALYEKGARPLLVTRIPLAGLDAPAANLQYLAKTSKWEPGFKPEDAFQVMEHGATEMTVRYHSDLKKWLAVMRSPELSSDAILLRSAPEITGPWSTGAIIYRIPEMQKNSPGYDKNTFCYAAKDHPEFEQPGSLLVTYVCNTMKVPELATNLQIYVPKVLSLPIPPEEIPSANASRPE